METSSEQDQFSVTLHLLAAVKASLDALNFENAQFLSERLAAHLPAAEEAQIVLARCHISQGRPQMAFDLLQHCRSLPGRYLLARACTQLGRFADAEGALVESPSDDRPVQIKRDPPNMRRAIPEKYMYQVVYRPTDAEVLNLLGLVYHRLGKKQLAASCYDEALQLNPFLWCAFESLCRLGVGSSVRKADDYFRPDTATSALRQLEPVDPFEHPDQTQEQIDAGQVAEEHNNKLNSDRVTKMPPLSSRRKGNWPQSTPKRSRTTPSKRITRSQVLKHGTKTATGGRDSPIPSTHNRVPLSRLPRGTALSVSQQAPASASPAGQPPGAFSEPSRGTSLLMALFRKLGVAVQALSVFECKRARSKFEELPARHYNSPWVQRKLARSYFEERRYPTSRTHFQHARRLEPWNTADMDYFSTVLWFMTKDGELSALAHELKASSPSAPETWIVIGNLLSLQKKEVEAIQAFQKATALDPYNAYAYTLIGHELLSADKAVGAGKMFRQALQIDPQCYNAWHGLGSVYHMQEKLDLAEYHYTRAAEICPTSVMVAYVGHIYQSRGDYGRAIEVYDTAMSLDSSNPVPKLCKATCLAYSCEYEDALILLHELIKETPHEANVYYMIGWIYQQEGKSSQALRYFIDAASCMQKVPQILRECITKVNHREELPSLDALLNSAPGKLHVYDGTTPSRDPSVYTENI